MRILCISGSRADYGGIKAVYDALMAKRAEVTLFEIEKEGDPIFVSPLYDIVVLLGDRSEILRTAVDMFLEEDMIIAHLSGGDVTEGSKDDSMRHAITKLSHIHFPTNTESAKRIIQMGEEPWRVHTVGYPGADIITEHTEKPTWVPEEFILAVWHPNTLTNKEESLKEATIVANALEKARGKIQVIVIGPNDDAGGAEIAEFLDEWADFTGNIFSYGEPRGRYLWLLENARCLVGNSSSGIYEAPSFGTPVLNIGDRQKGRMIAANVFDCPIDEIAIESGIRKLLRHRMGEDCNVINPFYRGNAAKKVAEILMSIKDPKSLLLKKFIDVTC